MVRRRRLAAELRRLREAAGLTLEEAGARLECSPSKLSRMETGRVSVSPRDVRDLLAIYGAGADQRDSLMQLARQARQRGWWQGYANSVEHHLLTYLSLEADTSEIRVYSASRVPILLQTGDYARALSIATRSGATYPGPPDKAAEILLERQRLAAERPPAVLAVVDESALLRRVGGPDVMRAQIAHLIDETSRKTTVLQFIPLNSGGHPAMTMPFVILGFPDPADPDVVAIAYPTGVLWIEDATEVDRYNLIFRQLQAAAMAPSDSVALMNSALRVLQ